jgi:hypothetical protein
MRRILVAAICLLSMKAYAVETEVQFENNRVRTSSVKLLAHEEVGWHRDDCPRVVVSFKGGTLTRIEADGSRTDLHFPKGEAVFLEADPDGELHKSVNNTCKPIELIVIQLRS